jgi:hypothetical protein
LVKNIIGVDFSLNSPAWCSLSEYGANWGSYHRTTKKIDNMLANENSPFKVLGENSSFSFKVVEKQKAEGEYWQIERKKIENFLTIADNFMLTLVPFITDQSVVFMEGISFGSSGNSLIDISMCTALLRERLVELVGFKNLHVYSPTAIKKFALKGNSKKDELYLALIDKYSEDKLLSPLVSPLKQNKDIWIKKNKEVETPCSDLIDATWISLYGKQILGETF